MFCQEGDQWNYVSDCNTSKASDNVEDGRNSWEIKCEEAGADREYYGTS